MRKIDAMHYHHGTSPGNKCRDCCNLVGGEYHDKHYYKCEAYGLTHSEASDWRLRYDACGLFNKPFDTVGHYPLIRVLRHAPKDHPAVQCDGQLSLEEATP